ncbi:hypothetical protein [Psychroserpens algicola]|uniref:hypothetical protein n=1 Tax=Psychroserpens algicola TaxID=1719034 RepID=UPI001953ED25|nr:hypothetical protein [Psychroserpens algicola]
MLDLSKPYGVYKNIIFYGDHEQEKVVYYLPNEVGLAPVIHEDNESSFDFFLQIFREGTAIKGGLEALEDTSGAIMSLGVQCIANEALLEEARDILIDQHHLPEDFFFALPEWTDGSIDLIALDTTTQDEDTISEDAFVESVIGSKKPSLMSSDLKAVFNVRLDRKGASLIAGALQGERSSVGGVLYDLKLKAMRPALDMTIEADLDRCHKKVTHAIAAGAAIKYGELTVSAKAEFEFIKEKLIEDGDIKVNVLSQVTDPDTKKMIDEMIKEFTDKVMRELFSPYVSPEFPDLPSGVPNPTPGDGILIGAAYKFQQKKLFHNKKISVDYRQRSATLKTHNPQSHLWLIGNQIKDEIEKYTQTVVFGDLWRENHLEVNLLHDFNKLDDDLLSAEVLIWRKKDGKKETVGQDGFKIPNDASPLTSFTITKNNQEQQDIAWITEADEPAGYYYQVKFTYRQDIENIHSPTTIFSDVVFSSSQDLVIIPQVLVPLKVFNFRLGHIDADKIKGVDVFIRSKDLEGKQLNQEILSLSETHNEVIWKVRNHPESNAYIEEERHFYFSDGRPNLKENAVALIDEELIIADPFEFKNVTIIPVTIGANPDKHLEIMLEVTYKSSEDDFEFNQRFKSKAPDFSLDEISIPVLEKGDTVAYTFTVITTDGELLVLEEGKTTGGPLILKIQDIIPDQGLLIRWDGPSFESEDLDYVRVEFKLEHEDGTEEKLPKKEFSVDGIPEPIHYTYEGEGKLLFKITKRYIDGRKEKTNYNEVTTKEIIIKP